MEILLVGCGKMGGAMLRRWITDMPTARFTAVTRDASKVPEGASHAESVDALGDSRFDAIIIACKPQQIETAMPDYVDHLAAGGCWISIAAGYSTASLANVLGDSPILRLMPNLPALIGRSVNGLYANAHCARDHREIAEQLAQATGSAIWVEDEDKIDRITAIAGSGTGYVFEVARSYVAAAEAMGFDRETARTLVLETMGGAIDMAAQSELSLEDLRNSVMSKKGTTEAGIAALRRDGLLDQLLRETTEAAYARACELR